MPTNLPPEYFKIKEQYRSAHSPQQKIKHLEEMLSVIPKHKGTDRLRGDLRRRLADLRSASKSKKGARRQESIFHIDRQGAGQAVLVGPPNVGKSSLVRTLTNATPEVAAYPFSTWGPTPGMMEMENVQIQLIDTPPLNEEHVEPELWNLVRGTDLILLVVDLQAYPIQQLEDSVAMLKEHGIVPRHLAEKAQEIDHPILKPTMVLVNKSDDEEFHDDFEVLQELMGPEWQMFPVSAATNRNLDALRRVIFDALEIIRVYSKPPRRDYDPSAPFVLKKGSTVEEFAGKVHRDFLDTLKTARVWGSAEYEGQMVGRDYVLQDGDVVELRT
jgi:hypothetical protein